jgi:CRISPR-associated protein Csx10
MEELYIELSALSPLAIRSDHAPSGAATAGYISSTTFIGALAAAHRLLRPHDTGDFERWFLSEQILYPNLYPASFADTGLQDQNSPVYPVPRTAQSCKRHPGFLFPQKADNDAHGVRDGLIDWALFELIRHSGADPRAALERHKECPHCGERMDSFDGYYRRNDIRKTQLIQAKGQKRLRTHSGIDRRSATVQEGILYNRQVFEEGMRFWGALKFTDNKELISEFKSFLEDLNDRNKGVLRVGTGRTRGMGKVAIQVGSPKTARRDPFELFKHRLEQFDARLHSQAQSFELSGLGNRFFFALTLHSPLILQDELLRYQGSIDTNANFDTKAARLEQLLGCAIPGLERIYQNAGVRRVAGWQELWGTPRMNEYAIEPGSVFLFACEGKPSEEAYQALFNLDQEGTGKRRAEGFGRVCVSDQFHQEIEVL